MVIYGDMSAHSYFIMVFFFFFFFFFFVLKPELEILNWVHFFKTNDVVSQ